MITRFLCVAGTIVGSAGIIYGKTAAEGRVVQCASFFPPFTTRSCAEPLFAICIGISLSVGCLVVLVANRGRASAAAPQPVRTERRRLSTSLVGAALGAAVPTVTFGLLYWIGEDSPFAVPLYALWVLVALPGALLENGGAVTMFLVVIAWAVAGATLGWSLGKRRARAIL